MKTVIFTFLMAVVVLVQCNHLFLGTNVNRPMIYHNNFQRPAAVFQETIGNLYFKMSDFSYERSIRGILAVDLLNTEASANVTQGGIGYSYVNIRMKSQQGKSLQYEIFIYA